MKTHDNGNNINNDDIYVQIECEKEFIYRAREILLTTINTLT